MSQRQSAGKHARWLFAHTSVLDVSYALWQRHRIFCGPSSHKPGAILFQTLGLFLRISRSTLNSTKRNPALRALRTTGVFSRSKSAYRPALAVWCAWARVHRTRTTRKLNHTKRAQVISGEGSMTYFYKHNAVRRCANAPVVIFALKWTCTCPTA